MGSCYSVAYTWYAWMLGSQVPSAGSLRYRNETVDGETTIEFQHLVDADEELLELGHGNQPVSLITAHERQQLETGRYDEILVHSTHEDTVFDQRTAREEEELRLEEEAYYEAKREAARAARQAQALEATRAAAATAAAAQATNVAMTQHADVFSSASLDMTMGAARPAQPQVQPRPAPEKTVRQAPTLDAQSQLEAFSQSAKSPEALTPPTPRKTAGEVTTAKETSPQREAEATPPPGSGNVPLSSENTMEKVNDESSNTSRPAAERVAADAASWLNDVDGLGQTDGQAAETGGYTIMDDDEEDFDSFLENVKAKNFGLDADTRAAETARRTSPPPLENGDNDEFTAFEESLS